MTRTPEMAGSPGNASREGRGVAWASIFLACVCCIAFGIVLVALRRAERGMPDVASLNAVAGFLFEPLRLPLLGAALLAVGLGVAGLVGRWRQRGLRSRRILAGAGLALGLIAFVAFGQAWGLLCSLHVRSMARDDLRQVGWAMQLYAREHEGLYPPDPRSILADRNIPPQMLRCPTHREDSSHECYTYIAGQWLAADPGSVLLYGKPGCLSVDGAPVLFLDGHVEWLQPYSRVLDLVEQTQQGLAARTAQSAPASAAM